MVLADLYISLHFPVQQQFKLMRTSIPSLLDLTPRDSQDLSVKALSCQKGGGVLQVVPVIPRSRGVHRLIESLLWPCIVARLLIKRKNIPLHYMPTGTMK